MAINNKKNIEEILGIAVSTGADFAEIFWETTRNGNVVLLGGRIDAIVDNTVTGAGIRAFVGTKTVYASTSDMSYKGLIACARSVAEAVGEGGNQLTVRLSDGGRVPDIHKIVTYPLSSDVKLR